MSVSAHSDAPEQLFGEGPEAMMRCDRYTRGQAIAEAIYEIEQCPRSHVGIWFRDFTASRRYMRRNDQAHPDFDDWYVFCDRDHPEAVAYWHVRPVKKATGRAATRPASPIGPAAESPQKNKEKDRSA